MLLTIALAFGMAGQGPVVMSGRDQPASPWNQAVAASCGATKVEILGHGGGRPLARQAQVRVNGKPLSGPGADTLIADLSRPSAVYRIEVLCPTNGDVRLRIATGEAQPDGEVKFRVGSATLRGDQLVEHSALAPAGPQDFWYR